MDLSMLPDFIVEATEHLEEMEDSLLQLEKDQGNGDILNEIFRSIHSIKGAAQYIGLERVSELSHKLESLLDLIRQGEKQLNQDTIDLFIAAKDRINVLVDELDRTQLEETEIDDLLQRIKKILEGLRQYEDQKEEADGLAAALNDAFDATPETETPDRKAYRLENETIDEEYDEELLDIFIQQLQENLFFLQTQISGLDTSLDKKAVLKRCRDTIKSLHSSANYMDYDRLCGHYNEWQAEIDEAEQRLSSGEETGFGFMKIYLDEIFRVYPRAVTDIEQEAGTEPSVPESEDDVVAGSEQDNLGETLDSLFGDSLESATAPGHGDIPAGKDPEDGADGLVAALSDAFDATPDTETPYGEVSRLENETIDEEYDEELLDIFMQQLQENLFFLQTQISGLDTSLDKKAVLKRCRDTIKSLHSSANYMGYDRLCGHYNEWQAEIDEAEQRLSSGEETGFGFMKMYIDEILRVYPRAATDIEQEAGAEPSAPEREDDVVAGSEQDNLGETLDSLFGDSLESATAPGHGDIPIGKDPEEGEEGLVEALSDAFDATTDTETPDGEVSRLENEAIDEEYDEELLDIFIQQLQENLFFLQTQISGLDTSFDKKAVLKRCGDTIKSLHSSANYMGYDRLCGHYNEWQTEIDEAKQRLSSGEEAGFGFMKMYLDEILRVYPRAATDIEREAGAELSAPKREDDFVAGSDQDNLDETLDSLFGGSSRETEDVTGGEEIQKQSDDKESPSARKVKPSPSQFDTVPADRELFSKLTDALDSSREQQAPSRKKPMHGVVEEMISTLSKEEAEQDTAEEVAAGEVSTSMAIDREPGKEPVTTVDREIARNRDVADEVGGQQGDRRKAERRQVERRKEDDAGARKIKHSMRVDTDKIDYLMNQVGELVVSRAYFFQLFSEMKILQQDLLENSALTKNELKPLNEFAFRLGEAGIALGRVSNELQEAVMKVRMLPISQLFKRYPRLVRDLVHRSDKQVNIEVRGEETELDKMVIEEISDPLIHIIRNAVDHGIETIDERKRLGKPESGTLTLEAYHESDHIVIEITDDGSGIDPERVKAGALAKGLYSEEELKRMTPWELTRIIMIPGFSTAETATETSGRGVGMDVVKKNIEKLNGTIDIESTVGRQTQICIKIPLTLAIIQALMVRVGTDIFTIPLTTVEETLRIFQHEISEIEGVEVIHLRDTTMPILRLSKIFGMQAKSEVRAEDKFFVVVVSTGMQEVGLIVDKLLRQEEVVIKPLADYLRIESGFSGATIIGDGAISLILDIPELVKMTTEQQVSKQKNLTFKRGAVDAGMAGRHTQIIH